MRKLVLVVLALVIGLTAFPVMADVSYGVIGGLDLATFAGSDASSAYNARLGFKAGGFVETPLITDLVLHAEGLFVLKGTGAEGSSDKINLYNLDFPVTAKYYLPLDLPVQTFVFGGPYLGLNLISKASTGSSVDTQPVELGLTVGAGVEKDRFLADLRYDRGLTRVPESDIAIKNSVFSLMVGYRLK